MQTLLMATLETAKLWFVACPYVSSFAYFIPGLYIQMSLPGCFECLENVKFTNQTVPLYDNE